MRARGIFSAAVVAAAVLATPAAHAAPSSAAVNACVDAFVDTYLSKQKVVRVRKPMEPLHSMSFIYSANKYTIALMARRNSDGEVLAQARCIASARGSVLVLDSPPIETYLSQASFSAIVER